MRYKFRNPWSGLILGGFSLVLGAVFIGDISRDLYRSYAVRTKWTDASATVISAESRARAIKENRKPTYDAIIVYRYAVNSQSYDATFHSIPTSTARTRLEVQGMLRQYPIGAEVVIKVNPRDPADSSLPEYVEKSFAFRVAMFGIFLCLIGAHMIRKGVRKLARKNSDFPPAPSGSSGPKPILT